MAQLADVSGIFTDANLKLYYKFSETAGTSVTDSSSGGNNGTASASSILNNIGGPFGGKGVFVAGSSNKITISDASSLKPTAAFSFGCWFKTSTTGTILFQSYSQNTNPAGFYVYIDGSGKLTGRVGKNSGGSDPADYTALTTGATTVTDGKWHHVTLTYDNSSTYLVYLDGVLETTTSWAHALAYAATNYVRVGCLNQSGSDSLFFNGDIDDLFLLNGTTLTQAQVNALYIRGIAPQFTDAITDSNLKLYYKFDETGGTSVTDSSSAANTGTASNASILNNNYGMQGYRGVFVAASSNKVTISDSSTLKPTGNFSIGCWFRTTDSTGGTFFQSYSQNTNTAGIRFQISSGGALVLLSAKNTGTTADVDYKILTASTSGFNDGRWHHGVATWDGSTIRLYTDGVLVGSVSWGNAPVYAATNYVALSVNINTGVDLGGYYNGDMDELFLLNGTVLSQAQINKLYNGNQGNDFASTIVDSNTKLLYKFDETSGTSVADSSGNSNTGTASAASIIANNTFGKFNNRGVFASASSNKITITDHSTLKPTGNFSVGAWFRTSTTGVNQMIFCSFSQNTNDAGIFLNIDNGSNNVYIRSAKNTGNTNNVDYKNVVSPATVTDGKWHHVVATWDGSTLSIYVDGGGVTTASWANAPAYAATNYVRVGCHNLTGTDISFFNGDIDDLFLINGTALTEGQVMTLYRIGASSSSTTSAALFFSQL